MNQRTTYDQEVWEAISWISTAPPEPCIAYSCVVLPCFFNKEDWCLFTFLTTGLYLTLSWNLLWKRWYTFPIQFEKTVCPCAVNRARMNSSRPQLQRRPSPVQAEQREVHFLKSSCLLDSHIHWNQAISSYPILSLGISKSVTVFRNEREIQDCMWGAEWGIGDCSAQRWGWRTRRRTISSPSWGKQLKGTDHTTAATHSFLQK